MTFRIEIFATSLDPRATTLTNRLKKNIPLNSAAVVDVYTIDGDLNATEREQVAAALANPVTQQFFILDGSANDSYNKFLPKFTQALEVGFRPGVTDNVATTTKEIIQNQIGKSVDVYSSRLHLLDGELSAAHIATTTDLLANLLIQSVHVKSAAEFAAQNGMDVYAPKVSLTADSTVSEVDLNISDEELAALGKQGISNEDGSRRGPLGLGAFELSAIRDHFNQLGRKPTDIEVETLAQTWSEHCKHTIFASPIDEVEDGIYRHYIKRATKDIRAAAGEDDICVSVFKDNSGGIIFDDEWLITDKVETHNTPSALDPFGGAITGIVGVNRDCMGFGQGAKPIINRYGFCLADPRVEAPLYRAKDKKNPMLSASAITDGVISGVESGGNQSGIPTNQGFLYFDPRYRGKPLVFAGTVGLIPRTVNGKCGAEKAAKAGDRIIVAGGKVGKDGIHGATFSSEALDEGSPVTAVQIGDPITQKKMSDALIKEAREQGLYNSITDNGAGGMSSSIGEMAEQSGGFVLDLYKVPLKYSGLAPWEIWISESQERMTLAVPPENVDALFDLLKRRGVEAWDVGEFTSDGRAVVRMYGKNIMDMSMDFLHDGLPEKRLSTTFSAPKEEAVAIAEPADYAETVQQMLARPNIASHESVVTQYDHEVQASSVLKPIQGKGRVCAQSSVTRPVLNSMKGVVTSHALAPRYSEINPYNMAAAAIDMAVAHAVATGAPLSHLALMDNFCWCSSDEPERLGQLKLAAEACYNVSVAYGTPWISGKDSMFNDFKGYDENGEATKISIPPTLLVSALGVVEDCRKAVSLDAKIAGDYIYIIGQTKNELGGSEYADMNGNTEGVVPVLNVEEAKARYTKLHGAINDEIIASAMAVGFGGLATTLAKVAIGGKLGVAVDFAALSEAEELATNTLLFSESLSRFVVSVAPENAEKFESIFDGDAQRVGKVNNDDKFLIKRGDKTILDCAVSELSEAYKSTWRAL